MPEVSNAAALTPADLRRGQQLVVERNDGGVVVHELMLALGPAGRLRGLLGRPPLRPGQGMLLRPCRQVHTFFMRYPIDVVFLARDGRVAALTPGLAPWRVSPHEAAACCVLELGAGQATAAGLAVGQQLLFRPRV